MPKGDFVLVWKQKEKAVELRRVMVLTCLDAGLLEGVHSPSLTP